MKLYVTDQISISSVQADTLRPGEDFEVNDAQGTELLKALPNHLSKSAPKPAAKAEAVVANKADPKLANKGVK